MFSSHGDIESCKVATNKNSGASLGYGFVKFKSERSAATALKELNGTYIQGKVLKVTFVDKAKKASKDAVSHTESIKSNVYIAGIPHQWTKTELLQYYNNYGRVVNCKVLLDSHGESRNIGFVQFSTTTAAQNAIDATNRQVLPGASEPVIAKFARDSSSVRYGMDDAYHHRNNRHKKKHHYMNVDMSMENQVMPMYHQFPMSEDLVSSMAGLNLGNNTPHNGGFKHKSNQYRNPMNYGMQNNMYNYNMMDSKNSFSRSKQDYYLPYHYNSQPLMMNNALPNQVLVGPNGDLLPVDQFGIMMRPYTLPAEIPAAATEEPAQTTP